MTDATSLEHLHRALDEGTIASALEDYKRAVADDSCRRVGAFANSALANLALELCQAAIHDCNQAINLDPYFTLSYLVKGVAYLWSFDEESAIASWDDGISHGGLIPFFVIMKRLSVDPNFRAYVHTKRFNVREFLRIVEDFKDNPRKVYTTSDTQQAFVDLRVGHPMAAIVTFSAIIAVEPANGQALKGRGVAQCLVGCWSEAVVDLTRAIEAGVATAESYKFRAVANAAVNRYSAAIADLSLALAKAPLDFEALAERGKIQLRRQMYALALADFEALPEEMSDLTSTAECYYGIGDLEKAEATVEAVAHPGQRALYVHHLVLRDMGMHELAAEKLARAVEVMPSRGMLTAVIEYMADLGRIHEAVEYARSAADVVEDRQLLRLLGLLLFETGDAIGASQTLKEIEAPVDFLDTLFNDTFEAESDLRFIVHLVRSVDLPVLSALRQKLPAVDTLPQRFSLPPAGPRFAQIANDADRLGQKCFFVGPEVPPNKRVMRALGLAVLGVAQIIRAPEKDTRWSDPIDLCRALLSLADLRNNIQWTSDGARPARSAIVPVYYLQRGDRISARFCRGPQNPHERAIARLKTSVTDTPLAPPSRVPQAMVRNLYGLLQHDMTQCGTFRAEKAGELSNPSVNLRYVGVHGWDLFVRPPVDPGEVRRYRAALDQSWAAMLSGDLAERTLAMLHVVQLIWLLQPLSHFSNEIGHVFLHAFELAVKDIELAPFANGECELFIQQMVQPDFTLLKFTYDGLSRERASRSTVQSESIAFWGQSAPTIGRVFTLLAFDPDQ
jgi:tetratricopeptide (TPR) repeat protein